MNEQETQTIAEILHKHHPVVSARKSKLEICPECKQKTELGLFGVCVKCHRRRSFSALPLEEKQRMFEDVVQKRYISAECSDLSEKLLEKIGALPEDKGLFLWGKPGVGKTYAMAALAKKAIRLGNIVKRISYEMLCLKLRDTFKKNSKNTEYEIIEPLLNADLLLIEDIGTTKSEGNIESDFSVRTLLVILDWRIEHCLPTNITTNRPIEELGKTFDQRIASRLVQACEIIKLSGEDKRCTKV